MKKNEWGWYDVEVAGLGQTFKFSPNVNRCGQIKDGVAFAIGNDGGWVIPLTELREMLRLAEEVRSVPVGGTEP